MATLESRVSLAIAAIRDKFNLVSGRIDDIEGTLGLVFDKVRVVLATDYTAPAGFSTIPVDSVIYDTNNLWDATNHAIIPKKEGYYVVNVRIRIQSTATGLIATFVHNGSHIEAGTYGTLNASSGTSLIYCNGTTDSISLGTYLASSRALFLYSATYITVLGPL